MHTRKKGTEIEHLVSQYLEGQNYKILQQNFTIHGGEIDIIARDPIVSTLVFIEVKYRTSNRFGEGVEQLTGYKRRHIKRASLHFLSAYLQKDNICKKIRYDFIVVTDVPSFDDFAAIKLVVEASGAVENLTMLEAIDFTKATTKASKIGYKPPGQ